jgi:hypothetical protein
VLAAITLGWAASSTARRTLAETTADHTQGCHRRQPAFPEQLARGRIMSTKIAYTTTGSVRGCCGHKHRTLGGAVKCLQRDTAGCNSQGGYSDRTVCHHDGSELADDDQEIVDSLLLDR